MPEQIKFQNKSEQEENPIEKREFTERAYNNLAADIPLDGLIAEKGEFRQQEREQIAKGILVNAFILLDNYNYLTEQEKMDFLGRANYIFGEARFINNLTSGKTDWEKSFRDLFDKRISKEGRQEARKRQLKSVK